MRARGSSLGAADLALERRVGQRHVARDAGVVGGERLGVTTDFVQAARAAELRRPVAAGARQDGVVFGERAIGVARLFERAGELPPQRQVLRQRAHRLFEASIVSLIAGSCSFVFTLYELKREILDQQIDLEIARRAA